MVSQYQDLAILVWTTMMTATTAKLQSRTPCACAQSKFIYAIIIFCMGSDTIVHVAEPSICFMDLILWWLHFSSLLVPYPREKGHMGGALYIGPKLGSGPIFQVSMLELDSKERPGKVPT
jgi:hypothetical protein